MIEGLISIGPIRTFNCDRCGKDRKNAFRNDCPVCHNKYCDRCWDEHREKEHQPRERYIASVEIL